MKQPNDISELLVKSQLARLPQIGSAPDDIFAAIASSIENSDNDFVPDSEESDCSEESQWGKADVCH